LITIKLFDALNVEAAANQNNPNSTAMMVAVYDVNNDKRKRSKIICIPNRL
jgi:hypothetical protein